MGYDNIDNTCESCKGLEIIISKWFKTRESIL